MQPTQAAAGSENRVRQRQATELRGTSKHPSQDERKKVSSAPSTIKRWIKDSVRRGQEPGQGGRQDLHHGDTGITQRDISIEHECTARIKITGGVKSQLQQHRSGSCHNTGQHRIHNQDENIALPRGRQQHTDRSTKGHNQGLSQRAALSQRGQIPTGPQQPHF